VENDSTVRKLQEMENEGILYLDDDGMKITTAGEPFIRNICSVFDRNFSGGSDNVFSKAI
jgi:oxygen-independent coproporphyrinogen-3 oxidase